MSGFTTTSTLAEMINKRKLKRKRGNNALSYRTWNEEKEEEEKQKI